MRNVDVYSFVDIGDMRTIYATVSGDEYVSTILVTEVWKDYLLGDAIDGTVNGEPDPYLHKGTYGFYYAQITAIV